MSIFSRLRQSKKAAKEHKAQVAEKEKGEAIVKEVPYKHVPTHAAIDALSGAPSSWKYEDRPKIREHHKRRSEMAASRTESSMSMNSYTPNPNLHITTLPSNASYTSYTTGSRIGEASSSNDPRLGKRSRSYRQHSYQDSGIGPSPLASQVHSEEGSPLSSSGNSTSSSSENLPEMKLTSKPSKESDPMSFKEKEMFERLHKSKTRKVGEAPRLEGAPAEARVIASGAVSQNPETKAKKSRWSMKGKRESVTAV